MENKEIKVAYIGIGAMEKIVAAAVSTFIKTEKPDVIVVADNSNVLKGENLQSFAEHLMRRDIKEVENLALVLKEEYGIEPATIVDPFAIEKDIQQANLIDRQQRKKEYHVPKKIGKVRNKPR